MKTQLVVFLLIGGFLCGYAQKPDVKWRLNLSGGLAYDVASSTEDEKTMVSMGFDQKEVKKLANDLRLGGQGNADIHYLINEHFGVGIKYSFYMNDGKIKQDENIPLSSGYGYTETQITEKDYVNYAGPSLHFRTALGNPSFFVSATLSGGYVYLRSEMQILFAYNERYPILAYKGTIGAYNGIGIEYFLKKKLAVGIDVGYLYTSFNQLNYKTSVNGHLMTTSDVTLQKKAVISRLDFSLGLKIYL